MKGFRLSPMRPDDHAEVVALWKSCDGMGDLESPEQLRRYLERNPGLSQVARTDDGAIDAEIDNAATGDGGDGDAAKKIGGRIVGAVLCGHDGRRGYLYHLAVASDVRRLGVARALVQKSLDGLTEVGVARCSIHIYADNLPGEAFWRRSGWRERIDLKLFARDLPSTPPEP